MDKVKAHADQQVEPIENVRVDIPTEVAEVVRRMMAKDPAERFQTPSEVADALAPFVDTYRTKPAKDNVSDRDNLASPPLRSSWPPSTLQTLTFGAFALILGTLIYVATDRGTLVVESVDESVEITVGSANADLRISDVVTGSTVRRLPSGEYTIQLKSDQNEFELSQNRFILKRGGKVIVKVTPKDELPTERQPGIVVRQVWHDAEDVLGAVSPNGRYASFVDWITGDLGIRDLILKTNRRVTNKGSWDASNEFAEFSEFSRDGKQLVYAWFNKNDSYDLRTIDFEGGEPRVIYASDDMEYIQPMDWSPDGSQILAVLSRKDKMNQIVLISVEEKTATVLKSLDWRYPGQMSFSPDGKYIVYDLSQQNDTLKQDLFVIATDGTSEIPLIEDSADHALLGWSPDGNWILFASNRTRTWDAWLVEVANGKRQSEPMLVKPNIGDVVPMGFTSAGVFHFAVFKGLSEICTASLDPESGEIGPRKSVGQYALGANIAPDWSPHGDLAYLAQQGLRGRRTSIIILSASGEERELVPQLSYIRPKPPAWSPDGRSLLVSGRDLRSRPGMFVVDINTGDAEQVVQGNGYGEWSPDGKAVYVYQPAKGRIYRRELETKTDREIVQAPSQGHVRFVVSPNGEQIAFTTRDKEKKSWVLRVRSIAGGDDVFVYDIPKGKSLRRLQWTTDGKSLVIGEQVDDKYVFSIIPAQGGVPRKLHLNLEGVENLKMHPDGKQVALNVKQKGITEISAMENFLPPLKDGE